MSKRSFEKIMIGQVKNFNCTAQWYRVKEAKIIREKYFSWDQSVTYDCLHGCLSWWKKSCSYTWKISSNTATSPWNDPLSLWYFQSHGQVFIYRHYFLPSYRIKGFIRISGNRNCSILNCSSTKPDSSQRNNRFDWFPFPVIMLALQLIINHTPGRLHDQ